MKLGAADSLVKPVDFDQLVRVLVRAVELMRKARPGATFLVTLPASPSVPPAYG